MSRVSFQYLPVNRRRHPAILSYRWEESGDEVTVYLGVSFCHNKDSFNRSLGRQIAEGRMSTRPQTFKFSRNSMPFHIQIVEEVRSYFSNINDRRVTKYIDGRTTRDGLEVCPQSYSYCQGEDVHTVNIGFVSTSIGDSHDNCWSF